MKLTAIDLNQDPALAKKARALYLTAFPREERLPWPVLRLNALRRGIDLTAWTDHGRFCGFTSSVTQEGMHFLLFFAVADECRGQGIGSAILQSLRQTYDTVVLNVEPLVPDAPNLAQRQRRFRFYERNGLVDTHYHVWEVGGMFRVLSTCPRLDVPAYKKIFRKLTLGVWNVKLLPAEEQV